MKRLFTTIIITILMFSPFASFSTVHGQEQVINSDITALSIPNINGFIDRSPLTGYLNEWDDALVEQISPKTEDGNSIDATLFTKYVGGNMYGAIDVPADISQFGVQIDLDGDASLSPNDIIIATGTATDNLGKTGLSLLQSESNTPLPANIQAISVYDGKSWIPLIEVLGLFKDPSLYAEKTSGIYELTVLQASERLGANKEEGNHFEFRFNPELLVRLLKEHGKDVTSKIESSSNINYGVILINQQGQTFGHPSTVLTVSGVSLGSYARYNFDGELIPFFQTDIGVDHVEVTQAVQFEDNSLSLVKNKPTMARVFISHSETESIRVAVTLNGYLLFRETPYKVGSLSLICESPPSPNRNIIEDSCNFLLPNSWIRSDFLILEAKVNKVGSIDTNYIDNTLTSAFNFKTTNNLNVYFVNVNTGTEETPIQVAQATVDNVKSSFLASMPMSSANFVELDWETIGIFSGDDHDLIAELNTILGYLVTAAILELFLTGTITIKLPDLIFGFRPGGGGHSDPSWNNHGPKISAAATGGTGFSMVMAHEFNHNLGPNTWGRHVADTGYGCSAPGPDASWQPLYSDDDIHALGWAPGLGLIGPTTPDYMSYCALPTLPESWVSDYRWEKLVQLLSSSDTSPLNSLMLDRVTESINIENIDLSKISPDDTARTISGSINTKGEVILNPSFEVPGYFNQQPIVKPTVAPSHFLRVSYANNTIEDYPIYTDMSEPGYYLEVDHVEDLDKVGFSFWLPDNGQIVGFEIFDNVNQKTILTRAKTGFTSQVTFNPPTSLKRGQSTLIKWDYSLTNNSNIYTQLQYSPNNDFWYSIGKPTTGTSLSVDFTRYPGSKEGSMRLLLSDGLETKIVQTQSLIQLDGLAPEVNIIDHNRVVKVEVDKSSIDNSIAVGSTLSLKVDGYDPESGQLNSDSFSWQVFDSSGVALLTGIMGDQFSFTIVKDGTYEIIVTGTDPEGKSSTDSIFVEVETPKSLSEDRYKEFLTGEVESSDKTSSDSGTLPFPNYLIFFVLIPYTFFRRKKSYNKV